MHGVAATCLFRPLECKHQVEPVSRDVTSTTGDNGTTHIEALLKEHAENDNNDTHTSIKTSPSTHLYDSNQQRHLSSVSKSLVEMNQHTVDKQICLCHQSLNQLSLESTPDAIVVGRKRSSTMDGRVIYPSNSNHILTNYTALESPKPWKWVSNVSLTPSIMSSTVDNINMTHLQDNNNLPHISKSSNKNHNRTLAVLKSIFDFSILKEWECFSNVFGYVLARSSMFLAMYIPAYAVKSGVSPNKAAFLVTVYGLVDMVSRLVFGYLGDLHLCHPKYIISAASALMAVFCLCGGLFQTFETLAIFSTALGVLGGVSLSLNTNNIIVMAGLHRLGPLLSLGSLVLSLSCTIQFPVLGKSTSC